MFIDPYRWQTVRIVSVIHESPDAVTIVTERPENYYFMPGQHTIMRVTLQDKTTRLRQYSFAESPDEHNLYFTITRSPGGEVSSWALEHASAKTTVDISQAFTGPLQHDLSLYKTIGMVGGGSGIVPLMAHLRHLRKHNSKHRLHVIYSTKSVDRCYENELVATNDSENIQVRLTDAKPRFSDDEIRSSIAQCDIVLVCGSRDFVTYIQNIVHQSFPAKIVRAEAFSLQ